MKRVGDDMHSGSQFKRPFSSSMAESSCGQNQLPGGASSDRGGGMGSTSQRLTINDALMYLKEIRETFQDQNEKYDMFLEIMRDFKAQRTDTVGVITQVKELLKGHNNLIYGFNPFLPAGYEITIDDDYAPLKRAVGGGIGSTSQKLTINDALMYLNEVRETFQDQNEKYDMFLEIMRDFKAQRTDTAGVIAQVKELFKGHNKLIYGFNPFLPAGHEITIDDDDAPPKRAVGGGVGGEGGGIRNTSQRLTINNALLYLNEVRETFQDQNEKYDMFLEILRDFKAQRTDTVGVIAQVKELFKGHNNLIYGFNPFLPAGHRITLDDNNAPPKRTVEFDNAISYVRKIKERFQHDDHVYKSFLDVLNLYQMEQKDINELYSEVASLFKDHLDLLEEFTKYLSYSSTAPMTEQVPYGRNSTQHYNEHGSTAPTPRHIQIDKKPISINALMNLNEVKETFWDQKEKDDMFLHVPKDFKAQRTDIDDAGTQVEELFKGHKNLIYEFNTSLPDEHVITIDDDNDEALLKETDKFGEVIWFMTKVKKRFQNDEHVYKSFLDALKMYWKQLKGVTDVYAEVAHLFKDHPDLLKEFPAYLPVSLEAAAETVTQVPYVVNSTQRYKKSNGYSTQRSMKPFRYFYLISLLTGSSLCMYLLFLPI